MRFLFLCLCLLPTVVPAKTVSTPLLSVSEERGTVQLEQAQAGLSGVIVRHFDDEHSAIIANATITAYDTADKTAQLALTPYDGLKQNSLPKGEWHPKEGDEVLMAPDYGRALLIAPDNIVYERITAAFRTLSWVHPDRYAAYLSVSGHPSPTRKDFSGFCTDNAVGLLYIYLDHSLFTLDCKSLSLLQVANAPVVYDSVSLPFYTRVENIREALWGEGSDQMTRYAPYYLDLISESNEGSPILGEYHRNTANSSFKRDNTEADTTGGNSWFGGLFDFVDDIGIGLERDNEQE